jgi:hypothetical protein
MNRIITEQVALCEQKLAQLRAERDGRDEEPELLPTHALLTKALETLSKALAAAERVLLERPSHN